MKNRKNYSKSEREKLFNKHKSDHLKENPNMLESALIGFHGRSLENESFYDLGSIWPSPSMANCFGSSDVLYYESDKRDPADPSGEGAQGFNKCFYHNHDKSTVLIFELKLDSLDPINEYASKSELSQFYNKSKKYKLPNFWAETSGWLGDITKVEYTDIYGNKESIKFNDWGIYVWDDMSTLMAIPNNGNINRIILWKSPDLKVNWRGIIN